MRYGSVMTDYTRTEIPVALERMERPYSWLARRMGMAQSHVWRVIHGERPISRAFVERACRALEMPEDQLFYADDAREPADAIPA